MEDSVGTLEAAEPLHQRIADLTKSLAGEYPPHVLSDLRTASLQIKAFLALHGAVLGETGFANAVRIDSGLAYPWPSLDEAEALSNAALDGQDGLILPNAPIRHIVLGRGEWVAGTFLSDGLPSLCFGPAPEPKAPGEKPTEAVAQFATHNGAVVISFGSVEAAMRMLDMVKEALDLKQAAGDL